MQHIDFLPVQYRQRDVRRQLQPRRIVVVIVFAALLAAAVVSQQDRKRQAEKQLAAIQPQYDLAIRQNRKLAEVWAELDTARNAAELFTYLRHPWPRTQILAALLAPLPEAITLETLQIAPEVSGGRRQGSGSRGQAADHQSAISNQQSLDKLPPAARDLKRLRDEFDNAKTVVTISGITSDSAALYRYLGGLGGTSLFTRANLNSLDSAENEPAGALRFRATLVVRPGYGQPGGPTGPEKGTLAHPEGFRDLAPAAHPNREMPKSRNPA
jgi:hypothetical protein